MTALAGIILAMVAYGVVELVMDAVVDPAIARRVARALPDSNTGAHTQRRRRTQERREP